MFQEDIDHHQYLQNDEESCLIEKQDKKSSKSQRSISKRQNFKHYFNFKIPHITRSEIILIITTIIILAIWIQIICIVKHDNDIIKLYDHQKQLYQQQSFIQIPHSKGQSQGAIQLNNEDILRIKQNIQKNNLNNKIQEDDSQNEDSDWDELEMIKPLFDKKEYKFMKLDNKLKVLLISNKGKPDSFISLNVKVGSYQEKIPGLAHFLEHMKFIATNQFTQTPNQFDNYLSQNSGSSNAYTESENTNYHYNISPMQLKESLKYFSYMFNKSQFNREYVMKEINAVNSEYVNSLSNDLWKLSSLLQLLSKKDHPGSRFTIGSNETLISDKFDILKELDKLDKEFYSANLMFLVIYSNQSIDDLISFVDYAEFDKIPNIDKQIKNVKGLSFDEKNLGKIYKLRQFVNELKTMDIIYQILKKDWKNREDYIDYLENVLYISEEGGYYQKLKEKNYISNLELQVYQIEEYYISLGLRFHLTDEGYQNIDELLRSFYIFVEEFKHKVSKKNFEKKKQFKQILFKYSANEFKDQMEFNQFTSNMHNLKHPEKAFIQGQYKQFSKKSFTKFLDFATDISKHIIVISGKDFDKDVKLNSKIFQNLDNNYEIINDQLNTQYEVVATLTQENIKYLTTYDKETEKDKFDFSYTLNLDYIPDEDVIMYDPSNDDSDEISKNVILQGFKQSELDQNIPNFDPSSKDYSKDPFVKKQNGLQKFAFSKERWNNILDQENIDNQYHPILLVNKNNVKSFIMLDVEQTGPQIVSQIKITNKNRGFFTFEEQAYQVVYLQAQLEHILEEFSKIFEARNSISISSSYNDITIKITGWDNKYEEILKKFIQTVQKYQPSELEWEAAKDSYIQAFQDELFTHSSFPSIMLNQIFITYLDKQFQSWLDRNKLIQQVKVTDSKFYQEKMFQPTNIDILFSGNVSPNDSIKYTKQIQSLFKMEAINSEKQDSKQIYKIVDLSQKSYIVQIPNPMPDDENSLTINIYQIGVRNLKQMIYLNLLSDKLGRFFFEHLRTKQTLGYIAGARQWNIGCVEYIVVQLQGNKKTPNEINQIIEESFEIFYKGFSKTTEEEFQTSKESLREQYEMLPTSLNDKIEMMWNQIRREKYDFDIRNYMINAIDNEISLKEYKQFFKTHFLKNASKISFQMHTQAKPFESDLSIKNYAKNLEENVKVNSLDEITKLNDNSFFECDYTI